VQGGEKHIISFVSGHGELAAPNRNDAQRLAWLDSLRRQSEAKANLVALGVAEAAHWQEKNQFTDALDDAGFAPERGNYYEYFAASEGPVQRRNAQTLAATPYRIVGPDEAAHPGLAVKTFAETKCPLTVMDASGGTAAHLGLFGQGESAGFLFVAAGNIDDDPDLDCWSIASFNRRTASGDVIPAGTPYHEQKDVPDPSDHPQFQ
jgi:hypothetical protein